MALGADGPTDREGWSGGWFEDRFTGAELDPGTWFTSYLPAWSSRERSRASHHLDAAGLTLDIPVDHPRWCKGDHDPPLRVSVVQTGNWSGPVGSAHGQQRFREGQVVREEQERFEGWLPSAEDGVGIKAFRDPALTQDFAAPRVRLVVDHIAGTRA